MATPNHNSQHQDTNHIQIDVKPTSSDPHNPYPDQEHDDFNDEKGEVFGVILSRRYHGLKSIEKQDDLCDHGHHMVRKTFSMRMEKQDPSALETAVRRAFSMRKTNSDSPIVTRYGRIIDDEYDDQVDGDEENQLLTPRIEYYKKRNKLFQACRRLFRF